jgi:hypothetical protein
VNVLACSVGVKKAVWPAPTTSEHHGGGGSMKKSTWWYLFNRFPGIDGRSFVR